MQEEEILFVTLIISLGYVCLMDKSDVVKKE